MEHSFAIVLILDGIELIFSPTAGMAPHLGLRNKVGNTSVLQWLLTSAHTKLRTFQPLTPPCHRGAEGAQGPGQPTQTGQKNVPHHTARFQSTQESKRVKAAGAPTARQAALRRSGAAPC